MNSQQVDVIDLLISTLREHEKRLSELITRLEIAIGAEEWN